MTQTPLRLLDTFSGIGGFSYAAERIVGGFETVQFVEREPFCQSILRKHWPDVPIHDDICTFNPAAGSADVVCGGFPCQDISAAGKGAGISEGTRSGLFFELLRVVCLVRPQFVVLENVSAITHRGLDIVLGSLAEAGFDAEWACVPAAAVGACHRRDRWWCVAYPNSRGWRQHAQCDGREDGRIAASQRHDAHGLGADAANSESWRRGARQGQRQGTAGHQASGAGDECSGSTAHPMLKRLEGPHQLAGSRPQWPAATERLSPDWRGYSSQPILRRGDDGLSGRVDRLKSLGNAVVPQVAAIPLARVLQLDSQ